MDYFEGLGHGHLEPSQGPKSDLWGSRNDPNLLPQEFKSYPRVLTSHGLQVKPSRVRGRRGPWQGKGSVWGSPTCIILDMVSYPQKVHLLIQP